MLSRLPAALALILLLAFALPAFADDQPEPMASPGPVRPLVMDDLGATLERVLEEHPSPPDSTFLLRSALRGIAAEMEAMGLRGDSLFSLRMQGNLAADAAAIDAALAVLLQARSEEERGRLLRAGLAAALESLDDPGTRLYRPHEYRATLEELGYALGGVGFFVDEEKDEQGRLVIVEMFEGFPAERLGIRRGDRLVAAAGHPTKDMTFNEMADIVRGPVGTRVSLLVQRGEEPPKEYTITREWLNPNPKGFEARLVDGSTGYVKVKYLGHRVHHDLREQIAELVARGAKRVVLDLRNCPGVTAGAVGVADLFLPAGHVVLTEVSHDGTSDWKTQDAAAFEVPLAILVNRYSSSAATVAAGALRDHGRAILVGEDTDPEEMQAYEKVAEELPDGSTAAVTVAWYRLPRGKALWREPIRPDIVVPMDNPTASATGLPGDRQYERALQIVGRSQ